MTATIPLGLYRVDCSYELPLYFKEWVEIASVGVELVTRSGVVLAQP